MLKNLEDYLLGLVNRVGDLALAIIYLLIAFLVAYIAKKVITRALNKSGAEERLRKTGVVDEKTGSAVEFIGKLVFFVVFVLFIPSILARLGLIGFATTVSEFTSRIVGYIPNVIGAILILYIGVYIAKIIRQILKALLNKIGLNELQGKLGVKATNEKSSFSNVIAGVVYVVILLLVIVAALEILGVTAIAQPVKQVLNVLINYIPYIFVSIILLIVGYQLSKLLAPVVENLLASIGADKVTEKLTGSKNGKYSLSKIISEVVRWLILIVFFVEAINVLNLSVLTGIGTSILAYLPALLSALIIMGGGILIATWLEKLILKNTPKQRPIALILKISIIVVAAFMTLSQLGFAKSIVNIAFIIILAGLAIAFAISFGLGGREFAANRLAKLEEKLDAQSEEDRPVETVIED